MKGVAVLVFACTHTYSVDGDQPVRPEALHSFREVWKPIELSCSTSWTRNLDKRDYFSRRILRVLSEPPGYA